MNSGRYGDNVKIIIFKLIIQKVAWGLWNCFQVNASRLRWWLIGIGSGNGLVPSRNNPLPGLVLTQINGAISAYGVIRLQLVNRDNTDFTLPYHKYNHIANSCSVLPQCRMTCSGPKRNFRHFDDIFVISCPKSYHFASFQGSQWWCCENDTFITARDMIFNSFEWRRNGSDGVSNHQLHGCFLNRLFRRRSKKASKFRFTGLSLMISLVKGKLSYYAKT